jgi:hypothetical protein
MGTLHEDQYTFFTVHSTVLRIRNFQTKVVEKIKTHTAHFVIMLFKRKVEKYIRSRQATDDYTIQHNAGCIPKAADTNPEYVILIALPLQQWLHERTSVLRYTCISCLVSSQRHHNMNGHQTGCISSSHCHHAPCISHVNCY